MGTNLSGTKKKNLFCVVYINMDKLEEGNVLSARKVEGQNNRGAKNEEI
jgi:hypothetical protein